MNPEAVVNLAVEAPEAHVPMHARYLGLLRANRNFRRLWLAQLISEMGDWFYSLAVYDLLLSLTGSGQAVSWAIILQTLPWFFMMPLSGHLVDRFPRRRVMIVADIVRGCVVLGLILVRTRSQVWMVYVLLGMEEIFGSLFEPARNAVLPEVVSSEELLAANALSSATWSTALAVGAALGGLVTALAGRRFAFVLNSLSFFVSSLLILRLHVAEAHLKAAARHATSAAAKGWASVRDGVDYLRKNPKVLVLSLAKTGLGVLAGSLLLLAFFGERILSAPGRGALAMGWLYSARGVGAGAGPLIADHLVRARQGRMWKSISLSYGLVGVSYLLFSRAPSLPLAALAICLAHMGGSTVWVMSTTLLQLNTDERFRGRVFALDLGMIMLAAACSNYVLGISLDAWRPEARLIAAIFGGTLLIPGLLWLPAQTRWGEGGG
jgi:MFS family permease